jgi:nucleoside-diphosphate-sugar epimerase
VTPAFAAPGRRNPDAGYQADGLTEVLIVRVLISGAAGFVGRHLAAAAARNRHDVVALVRQTWPAILDQQKNVRIQAADIAQGKGLPPGPFDAIFHCAAAIPSVVPDSAELFRLNVEGSRRFFEHGLHARANTIIFCSSMAVYGRIDADVVDPDTPIHNPNDYGRSKLESEQLLAELSRAHTDLGALSIRLPGVVGPGSHDNFLSDTMTRLVAGETVDVRNPDALFNNVVHIEDLAYFAETLLGSVPLGHRATTIAATDPLPIREVVGLLQAAAGPGAAVNYHQEGHSFLIANEHARTLGYRPATVRDSVRRFASAHRAELDLSRPASSQQT